MNLAIRDHKIYQMKAELENRKKMLCTKRKQLVNSERENTFLKGVADDYDTYNKHIISQKEQQLLFFNVAALLLLSNVSSLIFFFFSSNNCFNSWREIFILVSSISIFIQYNYYKYILFMRAIIQKMK